MYRPKCYDPADGQMYQLIFRLGTTEWEHLDYAETMTDKNHLMEEYQLAYRGTGGEVSYILLPQKYWDKVKVEEDRKARRQAALARKKETTLTNMSVNQSGELINE